MRDPNVCFGRTNANSPFDPSEEWSSLGRDVFTDLGRYATNCNGGPGPSPGTLLLNEFLIAENNSRANQYIELFGLPGVSYPAYAVLVVRGGQPNPGQIYRIYQAGTTNAGGYWTTYHSEEIGPGANTFLLVRNLNAGVQLGYDIDVNNDGFIDSAPWTEIADSVGVTTGQGVEYVYSPVVLAPNFDGRGRIVRGASRIPNGNALADPSAWRRNAGPPPGIVGFAVNTPNEQNREGSDQPFPTPTGTVTPVPTLTPLPTSSPFPTAPPAACALPPQPIPPVGNCYNILANGNFETGVFSPWEAGQSPVPAQIVAGPSQGSVWSALLGNPPNSGNPNTPSYSSVRQLAGISPDALSVTLRWRTLEKTQETASESPGREQDRHDVVLLSEQLDTVEILSRSRCNFDTWVTRQVDISRYRGQTLYAYFNAYNDGNGQRTWQYLDDVELVVCYPEGVTPGQPQPPVPPQPPYPPPCGVPSQPQPQPCPYATEQDSILIITPAAEAAASAAAPAEIVIGAPTIVAQEPVFTPFFAVEPQIDTPLVTATPIEIEAPTPLPTETALATATQLPTATDTPLPTATATPMATEIFLEAPSATVPPLQEPVSGAGLDAARLARVPLGCTELVREGDFEGATDGWLLTPVIGGAVGLETGVVHDTKGGLRSLRIGNLATTNLSSLSAAERNIELPEDFASLVLTFDYLVQAGGPQEMWGNQRADVYYMQSGQLARRVLNKTENDSEWRIGEEDLSALAGQPVRLRFSVTDEGGGTVLYVDNVSILACQKLEVPTGTASEGRGQVIVEAPTATLPPVTSSNGEIVSAGYLLSGEWINTRVFRLVAILFSILVIILFVVWGLNNASRRRRI